MNPSPRQHSACETFDILAFLPIDTVYYSWKEICTQQKLMRRLRKQCLIIFCIFSKSDKERRQKKRCLVFTHWSTDREMETSLRSLVWKHNSHFGCVGSKKHGSINCKRTQDIFFNSMNEGRNQQFVKATCLMCIKNKKAAYKSRKWPKSALWTQRARGESSLHKKKIIKDKKIK